MVRAQPKTDVPLNSDSPTRTEVGVRDRSAPLLSIIARRENRPARCRVGQVAEVRPVKIESTVRPIPYSRICDRSVVE